MTITRDALAAATRDIMNATGSTQWGDATILQWLGLASWQEWANILNAQNTYYSQVVTPTQDSNGQFDITDLSTGSGNTKKNFYRILSCAQPSSPIAQVQYFYRQSRFQDYPNPQPNTSLPYVWYRIGTKIQILPVQSGQQMSITVNWRPPRVDQIAAGSDSVDFPDGYEMLLAHDAAIYALMKGGSEVVAAKDLRQVADDIRSMMLADLGRQGTWPIVAQAFDIPDDWGG